MLHRQRHEGLASCCWPDLRDNSGQSVARTSVSPRAVVIASLTATLATATATTEVATVRALRSLKQTARLTSRDWNPTGRAGTCRGQHCVTRHCPGRHHVDSRLACHSFHTLPLMRQSQSDDGALLTGAGR